MVASHVVTSVLPLVSEGARVCCLLGGRDAASACQSTTPSSLPSLPLPLCCSLGGGAASFRYLAQSGVYELSDVDDAQEFR